MPRPDKLSLKIPLLVEAAAEGRLPVLLLLALTSVLVGIWWLG
jgi:hypothetical protein